MRIMVKITIFGHIAGVEAGGVVQLVNFFEGRLSYRSAVVVGQLDHALLVSRVNRVDVHRAAAGKHELVFLFADHQRFIDLWRLVSPAGVSRQAAQQ